MAECTHLDQIADVQPDPTDGCGECMQIGDTWVHLRLCLSCGALPVDGAVTDGAPMSQDFLHAYWLGRVTGAISPND